VTPLKAKAESSPCASPPRGSTWRVYDVPGCAACYDYWSTLTESRATARALEAANFGPGDSVLEVAVGTGLLFPRLVRLDGLRRCIGIEPAEAMLRRARRRLGPQLNEQTALCQADAREIPFPHETFDVIVNCYMLDLLSETDIRKVLREFRRILKPGGRLVLLVMARQSWLVQGIWMLLYSLSPALVGGCRPVPLPGFLTTEGWLIQRSEQISQDGFRSQLILARPTWP
jgi:ubiquinone/menaquinone biosynthesis C-methylase UbiE